MMWLLCNRPKIVEHKNCLRNTKFISEKNYEKELKLFQNLIKNEPSIQHCAHLVGPQFHTRSKVRTALLPVKDFISPNSPSDPFEMWNLKSISCSVGVRSTHKPSLIHAHTLFLKMALVTFWQASVIISLQALLRIIIPTMLTEIIKASTSKCKWVDILSGRIISLLYLIEKKIPTARTEPRCRSYKTYYLR